MSETEIVETQPAAPPVVQNDEANLLNAIVRAASDPQIDVEKMERLLEMQFRLTERSAAQQYSEALAKCQQDLPTIYAAEANTHTDSHYANLAAINKAIVPIYTRHGFSLSFGTEPSDKENHIVIVCDVRHVGGHGAQHRYEMPYDLSGPSGRTNKTMVHGSASAITYGRRYITNMIFNLTVSTEDDDGNAAGEVAELVTLVSAKTCEEILGKAAVANRSIEQCLEYINTATGKDYKALAELTEKDAEQLLFKIGAIK